MRSANLFVTAFYGILDLKTGMLSYANAGHNPPFLLSHKSGGTISALTPTGMPVGIDEDASWNLMSVQIDPGDTLLMYTDGIPDAQNLEGALFRERRLIETAQKTFGGSAQEMQMAILNSVEDFVGEASQFDDITLLIIQRDPQVESETLEDRDVSIEEQDID